MDLLREFTKDDWTAFAGAEPFSTTEPPLIAETRVTHWPGAGKGLLEATLVVDRTGMQLWAFIADDMVGFQLAHPPELSMSTRNYAIITAYKVLSGPPMTPRALELSGWQPCNWGLNPFEPFAGELMVEVELDLAYELNVETNMVFKVPASRAQDRQVLIEFLQGLKRSKTEIADQFRTALAAAVNARLPQSFHIKPEAADEVFLQSVAKK